MELMNNTNSHISSIEAKHELWRRGRLSWKLDPSQKELYELFHNSNCLLKLATELNNQSAAEIILCNINIKDGDLINDTVFPKISTTPTLLRFFQNRQETHVKNESLSFCLLRK